MRKKNRRRGKNLLSHMSCNYDQTKLEARLTAYGTADVYLHEGKHEVWLINRLDQFDRRIGGCKVAGFKSCRRAHRLVVQLNTYLDAHQRVAHA